MFNAGVDAGARLILRYKYSFLGQYINKPPKKVSKYQ